MDVLFELLLEFIAEVVGEALLGGLVELGLDALPDGARQRAREASVLAMAFAFVFGAIAGSASVALFGGRLLPRPVIPGIGVVVAPLSTGLVMSGFGRLWTRRGKPRPVLFTFGAGASFAFAMALARFMHLFEAGL